MKFIKRLLVAAIILIIVLALLLFIATTSPFITKVLVPALQTEEYKFSLDSVDLGLKETKLANLYFLWRKKSGETNMTLYVQSLKASYLLSSLKSDLKEVSSVSIVGPRVTIFPGFFSREEKEEKKEERKNGFDLKKSFEKLKIPLRLGSLSVPGASFSITTSEEKCWGSFSLDVKNFAPRQDASLNLQGNAHYVKGDDITVEKMPFILGASFSFADSLIPLGAKGSLLATNLTGRAGGIDLANWHLSGDLLANCEDDARKLALKKCSLELKQGKKDVLSMLAEGTYDFSSGDALGDSSLQIMPSELWQKLLGDRVPVALDKLEVSLRCGAAWDNAKEELTEKSRFYLKNLAYSAYPHLPPVNCELLSTAKWSAAKKTLDIDMLDLKARHRNGSLMLLLRSLSPVTIDLERLSSGSLFDANVAYELRDAELQWASPFIKDKDTSIRGGTVSLVGKTSFDPGSAALSGSWQVSLNDADFDLGEKQYRKLSGEALLDASLKNNDQLAFTLKRLLVSARGGSLLSAGAKGEGSVKDKNLSVRWDIGHLSSLLWSPNDGDPLFFQTAGGVKTELPKITLAPTSLLIQKGRNPKQALSLEGTFYTDPAAGKQKLLVASDRFDISALTASGDPSQERAKEKKTKEPVGEEKQAQPAKGIEKWKAEAILDFKELRYEQWIVAPCKLFCELNDGVASIKGPDLGFFGGTLDLKGLCDLKIPGYVYGMSLLGTNISCLAVSRAIKPDNDEIVSGDMKFTLKAQGKGTGAQTVKKELTAQLEAKVKDGALKHIKVLEAVGNALHYKRLSDFNFKSVDLAASVTNGIITVTKGDIRSVFLGLTSGGTIDFDKNIDFSLALTLSAQAVKEIILSLAPKSKIENADDKPGKTYPLPPIVVTGTLDNPKLLGAENIFRSLTQTLGAHWEMFLDVVPTDKVKEGVQKGIEKLGGVIQGGKNSDASQKADKLIQDGKNLLKGLFKKQ